ncbi:MAG TPA: DNA repair protein RadA [Acidimicrobiales bacterium]|nr:DNA repair protein RadA [Acidimicrobiales bacterium]
MAAVRTVHRCTTCDSQTPKWAGRCPSCGGWNTLEPEVGPAAGPLGRAATAVPLSSVATGSAACRPTGVGELDRVLGGGLVPGSVTLVGGEPGIGKSTLLLQAMAAVARAGGTALLVSAEESAAQVRLRAERLGAVHERLFVLAETSIPAIVAAARELRPDVLVVDSIQTVADPDLTGSPGSVSQVSGCASQLVTLAKSETITTVLVGHVTKDGGLAGPRVLEHVVDTVLGFEGDRYHQLRMLRATKHRFGPTGELGLFEMGEAGLEGVPDAGRLFLADRTEGVAGSVVVATIEGHRPLLLEIQALVGKSNLPMPRRTGQGIDQKRLGLLVAVLERRADVNLAGLDVYASVAGGAKIAEPGADLAIGLALASACSDTVVPPDVVACGEVGLAGEVRSVGRLSERLAEASRLGFRRALVPPGTRSAEGLAVIEVARLSQAVAWLDSAGPAPRLHALPGAAPAG